jgi:hypothetical protein
MSTNLDLILAYFKELEEENFFGTVEITLQGGKMAYSREMQSKQDFEIAVQSWDTLSDDLKSKLRDKFSKNEKFQALMKKSGKSK